MGTDNMYHGPVEKEELLPNGVKADTLVYCREVKTWTPANDIPSLADLFKEPEPEPQASYTPEPTQGISESEPNYESENNTFTNSNNNKPQEFEHSMPTPPAPPYTHTEDEWGQSINTPPPPPNNQHLNTINSHNSNNKTKGFLAATAIFILATILVFGAILFKTFVVDKNYNSSSDNTNTDVCDIVKADTTHVNEEVAPVTETTNNRVATLGFLAYTATQRELNYNDLNELSSTELRLLRNWIYARHGYIFKSPELQNFFEQQSWYTPKYSDVSSLLSATEIQNLDIIKSYE